MEQLNQLHRNIWLKHHRDLAGQERLKRIQQSGETRLLRLKNERYQEGKEKILIGARDAGVANCLAPVIKELQKRGYAISVLTDNPAEQILRNNFDEEEIDPLEQTPETQAKINQRIEILRLKIIQINQEIQSASNERSREKLNEEKRTLEAKIKTLEGIDILFAFGQEKPDLVLTGFSNSGGFGIEAYEVTRSRQAGIPVVLVEDFWGVGARPKQLGYGLLNSAGQLTICAFDKFSKELDEANLAEYIESLPPDERDKIKKPHIIVTGSPAFTRENIASGIEEAQQRVRQHFEIPKNSQIIAYMGGSPPEDLENLKLFAQSLKKLYANNLIPPGKKLVLMPRIHPSILQAGGGLAKYKKFYKAILNNLSAIDNLRVIDTMGKIATDIIGKAADALVSAASTEGVRAVYRGKLSLFMLLPGLGKDKLKKEIGIGALPPH